MSDPFDDFQREMYRRTRKVVAEDRRKATLEAADAYRRTGDALFNRRTRQQRPLTEQDEADMAVIAVMRDIPLKPGQMLLLGPQSVAILSTPGAYAGNLPDKLVLERDEWAQ